MNEDKKEEFHRKIIKESKEYVCMNCGTYSMNRKKITFSSCNEANVTLECKECKWSKETKINKYD